MDGAADLAGATMTGEGEVTDARFAEFNHRMLNSLAMISSIIRMESRAVNDPAGRAALDRVCARLIAVSNLCRILGSADAASRIRADIYLGSVIDAVTSSVGSGDRIVVELDAVPSELTASQAASLGLITNEAMTNAYKHAFEAREAGRIFVSLASDAEDLILTIADDGHGMLRSARDGLGTTLIESLAIDLSGDVAVDSGDEGTRVQVRFPKPN